jgi:hypothetical protein
MVSLGAGAVAMSVILRIVSFRIFISGSCCLGRLWGFYGADPLADPRARSLVI